MNRPRPTWWVAVVLAAVAVVAVPAAGAASTGRAYGPDFPDPS